MALFAANSLCARAYVCELRSVSRFLAIWFASSTASVSVAASVAATASASVGVAFF